VFFRPGTEMGRSNYGYLPNRRLRTAD